MAAAVDPDPGFLGDPFGRLDDLEREVGRVRAHPFSGKANEGISLAAWG
jgi:hypothetical protein